VTMHRLRVKRRTIVFTVPEGFARAHALARLARLGR
jgi:hypothetical protein